MKTCGVYTITNLVNGKIYVGCSTNLRRRAISHKHYMNTESHSNRHLNSAIKLYGKENFLFEILVECLPEHMYSEENYWCNMLCVHDDRYGYNIDPTCPENKPIKKSEETCRKIGDAHRGKVIPEQIRRHMSEVRKGRVLSEEHKKKISEANKGRIVSEDVRRNMSAAQKGKKMPHDAVERIRVAITGKKWSAERLANWLEAIKNRKRGNIDRCIAEEIRKELAINNSTTNKKRLAEKYQVTTTTIHNINTKKVYK